MTYLKIVSTLSLGILLHLTISASRFTSRSYESQVILKKDLSTLRQEVKDASKLERDAIEDLKPLPLPSPSPAPTLPPLSMERSPDAPKPEDDPVLKSLAKSSADIKAQNEAMINAALNPRPLIDKPITPVPSLTGANDCTLDNSCEARR